MTAAADAQRASVQRRRKMAALEAFTDMCDDAEGLFIASYTGLDVARLTALRRSVRAAGGQVKVLKNTVAKRALEGHPRFAPLAGRLRGQLLYGAGPSAPAVAKALCEFAKEQEQLVVHAGAFAGSILERDACQRLAALPSKEELLATLAATLNAPIVKLARTLQEVPSSLARALAAVRDAQGSRSSQ